MFPDNKGYTGEYSIVDSNPNYALNDSEIISLLSELLGSPNWLGGDKQPFVLIHSKNNDPVSNIARTIEREAFEGRFPSNTAEMMRDTYKKYEDSSHFILIVDRRNNTPVGTMRLIENTETGMISLDDVFLDPIDNDNRGWGRENVMVNGREVRSSKDLTDMGVVGLDIATIAIRKGFRREDRRSEEDISDYIILGLFYGLNEFSKANNVDLWFAILDDRVLKHLEGFGLFFDTYPGVEAKPYLDSPRSTPVFGVPNRLREDFKNRHTEDGLYRLLAQGIGIQEIFYMGKEAPF